MLAKYVRVNYFHVPLPMCVCMCVCVYVYSFECQATCVAYDAERRYVFAGLDTGLVHVSTEAPECGDVGICHH